MISYRLSVPGGRRSDYEGGVQKALRYLSFRTKLRNPQSAYNKVRDLWELGLESETPSSLGRWRTLLERCNLDGEGPQSPPLGGWVSIIDAIIKHGRSGPHARHSYGRSIHGTGHG